MILRSTRSYSQVCARTLLAGCLLTVATSHSAASAEGSAAEEGAVTTLQATAPDASEADCDEVYLLKPAAPFATPQGAELAPIFRFTVPWGDEPRQLIGIAPVLDNKKIIGNFRIGAESERGSELIYVWQPGDTPPRMPAGVGQFLPSGSAARLWLQPHYRNAAPEQRDASGARLCVVKGAHLREHVAGMTSDIAASVPGGIPADGRGYMVGRTCRVTAQEPVTLVTVAATMRTSGSASIASVIPREGASWNFYAGGFDFSYRQTKLLPKPVLLQTGDVVDFSCLYKPLSQDPRVFGDNLADETCVLYTTYHPHGALRCEPIRAKIDPIGTRPPVAQGS